MSTALPPAPLPKWKAWWISTRPRTLTATIAPLLISFTYLYSLPTITTEISAGLSVPRLIVLAISCLLLQINCNFTNDYYDFLRGTDDNERLGPKRMLQQGIIAPEKMKFAITLLNVIFFLLVLYFSYTLSWLILPLGGISMAVSYAYTGGKYPLGYHALGDFFAFWFFGPIFTFIAVYVGGYAIVEFDWVMALLIGVSPGCFSLTMLNINNVRDLEQDRKKGKITIANLIGFYPARHLLIAYFSLALTVPVFILNYRVDSFKVFWLLLFIIPLARFIRLVYQLKPEEYNRLLGFSGMIYVLHTAMVVLFWN